jgi:hypothetical protein
MQFFSITCLPNQTNIWDGLVTSVTLAFWVQPAVPVFQHTSQSLPSGLVRPFTVSAVCAETLEQPQHAKCSNPDNWSYTLDRCGYEPVRHLFVDILLVACHIPESGHDILNSKQCRMCRAFKASTAVPQCFKKNKRMWGRTGWRERVRFFTVSAMGSELMSLAIWRCSCIWPCAATLGVIACHILHFTCSNTLRSHQPASIFSILYVAGILCLCSVGISPLIRCLLHVISFNF